MSLALLWSLPLIPAGCGLIGLLLPFGRRRLAAALGVFAVAAPLAATAFLFLAGEPGQVYTREPQTLARFGELEVELAIRADLGWLTLAVALAVTAVALAVQVYSIDYLGDDPRYAPYAAQVSLFTAAMLLTVVADDLIVLLIGWEVMGACSYLLIGHYRKLAEAPAAAVKAFLVTRVGDVGFVLGVMVLGVSAGTFRISELSSVAANGGLGSGVLLASGLLILAGAVGKSAQFPLHTWLPDAMAGPTPISALIHAATMVAAGAVALAKLFDLYAAAENVLPIVAVLACLTMLGAALAAFAAEDLKRVLAWSTCSQVAMMFGGLAAGASSAALLHLFSHAFFKAGLFLCAGAVIHRVGSNALSAMGGLRRGAPATFWTMTIGFAALAGLPLTSGFWTKELILHEAHRGLEPLAGLVLWSGILTAGITAAYCARTWLRVFFGARRGADAHAGDPARLQTIPMWGMAAATVLASLGLTIFAPQNIFGEPAAILELLPVLAALAAGLGGVWLLHRRDPGVDPARVFGPTREFAAAGFGFDALQNAVVVRPTRGLARLARRADEELVDGAVEGGGAVATRLASAVDRVHGAGLPRHLLGGLAGVLLLVLIGVLAATGALS